MELSSLAFNTLWHEDAGRSTQMTISCALIASREALHPAGNGPPDFIWRIFLEEMDPRDRNLGLRGPRTDGVEIRAAGQERTGFGLQEQLGHSACRQPFCVGGHDRSHVGRTTFDGDFPRP